jgi:hypothetical protein
MMMKKMQIILMAVLLAAGMGYSAILTNLTVNFTGQTAGLQPTGANLVEPVANTSTNFVQVVASSAIGSGEAVRIYDTSTNAGTGLHYNFVAGEAYQVNAVGVKFQYTQRATLPAGNTGAFSIQVGSYNTFAGTSNKISELQVRNDGRVLFAANGNPGQIIAAGSPLFVAGTVHTVEMFVNDQDAASVKYWQNGTEYSLAANSHIVYIDNVGYAAQSLNLLVDIPGGGTVATTEWNLGRLGFSTSGGVAGDDFEIDNIQVTDLIPEPATTGMLLLGAVTVLAIRRRRA